MNKSIRINQINEQRDWLLPIPQRNSIGFPSDSFWIIYPPPPQSSVNFELSNFSRGDDERCDWLYNRLVQRVVAIDGQ